MAPDGVMHGLAGWFECEFGENVRMLNSPLATQSIKRQQAFLPIDKPLNVMARPPYYLIAWEVRHAASGHKLSQETWLGDLFMPEQFHKTCSGDVPRLSHVARAKAVMLGYCDGLRSVAQIQADVLREHPDLFPSPVESTQIAAAELSGKVE